MMELTKKGVTFKWTTKHEQTMEDLKRAIMTAPVFKYSDFGKTFIVITDALGKALGATLPLGTIGEDLPIYKASQTPNKAEQKYSTTDKELLAIAWGISRFYPYAYGTHFTVVIDHKPLTWLFSVKNPGSRLMCSKIKLSEHEFDVQYKAGKNNTNPDALSRIYIVTCSCDVKKTIKSDVGNDVTRDDEFNKNSSLGSESS